MVMFRSLIAAILTSALVCTGASAQSEELNAAIDAYLNEDYRHVDVIARFAEDGVPEAIAVIGRAHLYGNGVEADQLLGVALLEQAAGLGERSSPVHLGRVFEFGLERVPVDLETAAEWYVEAARNGDTSSAPVALKRLPRDVVIAAGGAAWASENQAMTAELQAESIMATPVTISPAAALLASTLAPAPLKMDDGLNFPILADTRLSSLGDAAASCFVVLKPEIERQKTELESLMKLDGFGADQTRGSRHLELADSDRKLDAMSEALRASESVLNDPTRNGGLSPEDVRLALVPHSEAFAKRPETGPGTSLCGTRLLTLINGSADGPASRYGSP